ncbi:MAG TPA: 3-oxoacyl-[acyl-carrier-protein] reductase [bacterium]|nr:3-oxoacyl-[acyl-carrier-protein] reductase [bacterium]HNT65058.1 3-oxoacyl-[acyl-carrier-protein] reductase [bacterium]HOX84465.1 3-oxoacyl-[acyl-carrier-protein] reductase [bacterium]HPG45938.1 3-oxoacyl-[acyl-carrier-protein] reductase [bacterium]HPM97760.1 3-oxoacyl-[acyl-carrier-protein] reductase [bacterium]
MNELQDQVALVTGAARGIGRTIALKFAENGAHLVLSDLDLAGAEGVAREIEALGRQAISVEADVSNLEQADQLVKRAIEHWGRIDILVNNAGITRDSSLIRMDESQWDMVIRVNLKGTFNCLKAATRPMMKQKKGRIINISSVVGVMGNAGQANYAASKAGVIGLTKSAAKELAGRNILVNAVAPGFIETEMTLALPEKIIENYKTLIPLQRLGRPEDVAEVCVFLAGPHSSYITGQVIHVDGGMVM